MLIRALEIQLHRRLHFRPLGAHAFERQPRVRPYVHDVADLIVVRGVIAQQLAGLERKPGVDAALLDALRSRLDELLSARMEVSGLLVNEQRNGHAPGALARDTPVGTTLD